MKRTQFKGGWLPIALLLPQLTIIAVFFYLPALTAVKSSFYLEDPFGFGKTFVGLSNYLELFASAQYRRVAFFTLLFTLVTCFFALAIALLLAVKADKVLRGARAYRTLIIWVYAVAPPAAGLTAGFLFNQSHGNLTLFAQAIGWDLTIRVDYFDTAFAMAVTSIWLMVPINFIFFLSGLQTIPKAIKEAALLDNRSGIRRFWDITFPLLAPTAFFLVVINITYALFDTFGIVDTIIGGEPGNNPLTLVYKIYVDGFRGNDIGGSSAQSVVLMVLVLLLTMFQFRFIERRIHYT